MLSIIPCLHTQLPEHNRSYWKVSRGWGHLITWNGPVMGHLNLGCPGGCLNFDLTCTLWSRANRSFLALPYGRARWLISRSPERSRLGSTLLGLCVWASLNRPFDRSGHMVRNKLCWEAINAVGLPKQRNSYKSSPTSLCFESPTALFASLYN